MINEPRSIAACLAACSLEELSAFAESHHAAAAAFTELGRHGESAWQEAIAIVLAVALLDRLGEPPLYEIDDPDAYLTTVAGELDDLSLNAAVLSFAVIFTSSRVRLSPAVVDALRELNRPLLLEYRRRTPPTVA